MEFVERLVAAQRAKHTLAILGVDPQLDSKTAPGIPPGYTLARFCCEVIEACAPHIAAIKPQLAFFEARGLDGMRALIEVLKFARTLDLVTVADAKRGDVGITSAAYAEAFLGDGDFACDAVTINPYLGSDALAPFVARVRAGRGLFVLVKTSNPSSGEFQDLEAPQRPLWEAVAERVHGWGSDFVGADGLSPVGAVVGATYPEHARRARELMPDSVVLIPGYGAQGGSPEDSIITARADGLGAIVSASRSLMYAYLKAAGPIAEASAATRGVAASGVTPGIAAATAAATMREALNHALTAAGKTPPA
jgi:orotidine-5'-phosphate decarboxylase